jgi:hypothetical protein
MDSVGVGFPSIEAQDFDSVEARRHGTRQPVFRVARLLMKRVAGHDFFDAAMVAGLGSGKPASSCPPQAKLPAMNALFDAASTLTQAPTAVAPAPTASP